MSQSSGQRLEDEICDSKTRPSKERICLDNPECVHEVPQSSHIEHKVDKSAKSFWSKGNWGQVSLFGKLFCSNHNNRRIYNNHIRSY